MVSEETEREWKRRRAACGGGGRLSQAPPSLSPPAGVGLAGEGGYRPTAAWAPQHQAETLPTRCTHRHPTATTPGPQQDPKAGAALPSPLWLIPHPGVAGTAWAWG